MNLSNKSYKALAIPYFKEIFDIIDEIMISHGHLYYLIGANAIALELLKDGISPSRGTKDIDFAVMLSEIMEFDAIILALKDKGFTKVKEIPHRVYHPEYNVALDILPFGQIEQEFTVRFSDSKTELHVLGLTEVMKDANNVDVENISVSIPPLPGMVLLKLIAWGDRPDQRGHDLENIFHIIEKYFDYNFDEIVEHHHDTFLDDKTFDKLNSRREYLSITRWQ